MQKRSDTAYLTNHLCLPPMSISRACVPNIELQRAETSPGQLRVHDIHTVYGTDCCRGVQAYLINVAAELASRGYVDNIYTSELRPDPQPANKQTKVD